MITAVDVYERTSKINPVVDDFIEDVLIPKFYANLGKGSVRIVERTVIEYFNHCTIKRDELTNQLKLRGFDAKFECEDRPCGVCYYTISIPPQES